MIACDEAVRAVAQAICEEWPLRDPSDCGPSLNSEKACDEENCGPYKAAVKVITAYRAHTSAGAGEAEKKLRAFDALLENQLVFTGHLSENEKTFLSDTADLIAAQREQIAELKTLLTPFAALMDAVDEDNPDSDFPNDMLIEQAVDYVTQATLGDLRRARAALEGKK